MIGKTFKLWYNENGTLEELTDGIAIDQIDKEGFV